jgi:hypothetical protein
LRKLTALIGVFAVGKDSEKGGEAIQKAVKQA